MKKPQKWIDEYDDEDYTDKKRKTKFKERRKNKRLKNAIRSLDVHDLERSIEDDY